MTKKTSLLGNWGRTEGRPAVKTRSNTWTTLPIPRFGKYSVLFGPPKKVARIGEMTGRAFLSRYGILFIFLAKNKTDCCILKDEITCQRDPLTKSMCVYFCEYINRFNLVINISRKIRLIHPYTGLIYYKRQIYSLILVLPTCIFTILHLQASVWT